VDHEPNVARRFARGHRRITVPDPVIATGTINKSDIFWATNCRNEYEILGEPRDIKVEGFQLEQLVAHCGWLVTNYVLKGHGRDVEEKTRRFVGLEGVHPITIARAHVLATKRIGYVPKRVRVGNVMEAPADVTYWRAVLAAVAAATLSAAAEIKQCETAQQAMQQAMINREQEWLEEGSEFFGDYYGD
jgi:hypothetical protein